MEAISLTPQSIKAILKEFHQSVKGSKIPVLLWKFDIVIQPFTHWRATYRAVFYKKIAALFYSLQRHNEN